VIVLAIAVTAWIMLLRRYGGTGASVELDAIRTAGALVVGTGVAVALLLAARRQRSTELTLVHTEHDATERRTTELYTASHQHVVTPTPLRDRALVVAGARPDQGLDQPVPLRWAADPPIQDLIQLGAAVALPTGQRRLVQTRPLLQPPQPNTELRNWASASHSCHGTFFPQVPMLATPRL